MIHRYRCTVYRCCCWCQRYSHCCCFVVVVGVLDMFFRWSFNPAPGAKLAIAMPTARGDEFQLLRVDQSIYPLPHEIPQFYWTRVMGYLVTWDVLLNCTKVLPFEIYNSTSRLPIQIC